MPSGAWPPIRSPNTSPKGETFSVTKIVYLSPADLALFSFWNKIHKGQTGPCIFPQNANDLNFPVQGDLYWWYLMVTGKPGKTYRIEVFSNGVSFYNSPGGAKIYVKMTAQ